MLRINRSISSLLKKALTLPGQCLHEVTTFLLPESFCLGSRNSLYKDGGSSSESEPFTTVVSLQVADAPKLFSPKQKKKAPTAPSTLQQICVVVIGDNFRELAPAFETLPPDLLQLICNEIASRGDLSHDLLDLDLDLDSIILDGYPTLTNEWLESLRKSSPRLRALDLSRCSKVTDHGIHSLSTSRHMKHLKLNFCVFLTDASLVWISGLDKLVELQLQGCEGITGPGLKNIRNLIHIQSLDLSFCPAIDCGLEHLEGMKQLSDLNLGWCEVGDKDMVHLAHLTSLTKLALSCTKVTDAGIATLSTLVLLCHVELAHCNTVSDASCKSLATFSSLTHLNLSNCPAITNDGLGRLSSLVQLRLLDLSYASIDDGGMPSLRNMVYLKTLNLDSCFVTDAGCEVFTHLHQLEEVNLSDTCIANPTIKNLVEAAPTTLRSLNVSYSKVSNIGLLKLKSLKQLTYLNIDSGSVSDDGIRYICRLTSLTALDLFGARIHDIGAAMLFNLTNLQRLELCGGCLTDMGAVHIARLRGLTWLSLAQNTRLGDAGVQALARHLTNLESLNLNHTKVTLVSLRDIICLPSLYSLSIVETSVLAEAIQRVRLRKPNLLIKHSYSPRFR